MLLAAKEENLLWLETVENGSVQLSLPSKSHQWSKNKFRSAGVLVKIDRNQFLRAAGKRKIDALIGKLMSE